MKIIIEIELGNAAMESGGDVANALLTLAPRVAASFDMLTEMPARRRLDIRDDNGNRVGFLRVTED